MKLHVVSWNVLAPVYMKCHYYPSTTCQSLSVRSRRPRINHMLQWMNADVYFLQEVTQSEFKRFQTAHPTYRWFFQPHAFHYWKESSHHEWNGNAIALKNTLPFRNVKVNPLTLSPGNRGLMVTCQWKSRPMALISIHLDDKSDHCRTLQWTKLASQLPSDALIILGGDLNDESGDLIARFQRYGFKTSPSQPTHFEPRPMALDYLMVMNESQPPFWYVPCSTRTSIVSHYGSDHLPVIGVVKVD